MTQYGTKWHQTAFIGHKELFKKLQRGSRNLQCKLFENHRKSPTTLQCIASEASYFYILSGQKLLKNAKIGQIGEFLKN